MKKISFSKLFMLVFIIVIFIGSFILAAVNKGKEPEKIVIENKKDTEVTTKSTEKEEEPEERETVTLPDDGYEQTYMFYSSETEGTYPDDDDDYDDQDEDDDDYNGFDEEPAYTEEVVTTRDIITSRARTAFDGQRVYLDLENVSQYPELPTGCEITALTILLRHYGFSAEKTDMARNYLPTSWGNAREADGVLYKDSFFDYFIGDPFSRGYGCFSGAIETAAESYISDHGGGYYVSNISGCSPDTLYDYVSSGTPVLCWATDGMIPPEYYETWYDNDTGERLDWYLNEHCFVLVGFDMDAGTVTLNDPAKGIIDYDINKFETRFAQMHSQALVIKKSSGSSDDAPRQTERQTEDTPVTIEPIDTLPIAPDTPADIWQNTDQYGFEDIFQTIPQETTQQTEFFDNDFPVFEDIN
ncbi:MAG: C39 family peptidase [Oscillospiraceae bacterium]|nr:C39 family peptidase [Oscillospiraceae bacterium]